MRHYHKSHMHIWTNPLADFCDTTVTAEAKSSTLSLTVKAEAYRLNIMMVCRKVQCQHFIVAIGLEP